MARVWAEGLAVIAENDPDGFLLQSADTKPVHEFAQGSISVMQGVAVSADVAAHREGAAFRSFIRMMAGEGEISEKASLAERKAVDPRKNSRHGGRLIDAEARIAVSTDVPGILQRLISAIVDNQFHTQIREAAGMDQSGMVSGIGQRRSNGSAWNFFVRRGEAVKFGAYRAKPREQTFDAFRVDGIGVLDHDRVLRPRTETWRHILLTAGKLQVLAGCRFQAHHYDIAVLCDAAKV